jgi:hypothetical protein
MREAAIPYALSALVYTLSVALGMLLLFEVGRRIGLRRRAKAAEGAVGGSGVIEGRSKRTVNVAPPLAYVLPGCK